MGTSSSWAGRTTRSRSGASASSWGRSRPPSRPSRASARPSSSRGSGAVGTWSWWPTSPTRQATTCRSSCCAAAGRAPARVHGARPPSSPSSEFPLTSSGKVDRKRLPAPVRRRPQLGEPYVAPRNALERLVAEKWQDDPGPRCGRGQRPLLRAGRDLAAGGPLRQPDAGRAGRVDLHRDALQRAVRGSLRRLPRDAVPGGRGAPAG